MVVQKKYGLMCFSELPNILFTKYKNIFNAKKLSYEHHISKIFINFAPLMTIVNMLINHYSQKVVWKDWV